MSDEFDPYLVLGIAVSAPREQAHEAYRVLAARHHPDRCVERGATELMSSINRAWHIVGDDARRRVFDAERATALLPESSQPFPGALSERTPTPAWHSLRAILVATTLATCAALAVLLLIAMSQSGVRG